MIDGMGFGINTMAAYVTRATRELQVVTTCLHPRVEEATYREPPPPPIPPSLHPQLPPRARLRRAPSVAARRHTTRRDAVTSIASSSRCCCRLGAGVARPRARVGP